jgi:hypothetical protein
MKDTIYLYCIFSIPPCQVPDGGAEKYIFFIILMGCRSGWKGRRKAGD